MLLQGLCGDREELADDYGGKVKDVATDCEARCTWQAALGGLKSSSLEEVLRSVLESVYGKVFPVDDCSMCKHG